LGIFTFYDFSNSVHIRRTFVFYGIREDIPIVEERMLPRLTSEELEIRRYIEEALLGPVSPETAPLFFRDTRLRSLMYRDGIVYADLSEFAVFHPMGDILEEGVVFRSLQTLEGGILRNFPTAKEVRLFINGFRVKTRNSA